MPDADHYAVVEGFANPNSAVFRAAGGADGNAEARGCVSILGPSHVPHYGTTSMA